MHCLGDRSTFSPIFQVVRLCLVVLIAFVAGCGSTTAPSSDSSEAPVAAESGGLGSLFGASTEDAEGTTAPSSLKTGDVSTNSIGMKLGVLPPGEFEMGSPETEEKRSGDESRHRVRLTKPAFMTTYEITQAEFLAVMETSPSGITDSDRLPVQNVSWEQAVAFCRKLSELPEEKAAGRIYQLPTESQWEYACRAGSTTPTSFGGAITSSQANFDGNYPYGTDTSGTFVGKPQAVGSYEPNAWGFYDMHGNVWEWCRDWYAADYYTSAAADDPEGPATGISHVIRGGSWYNFGYVVRSSYRSEFTPPLEANIYGFRVVASFGPGDVFAASELDNPNPTRMSSPPSTPVPAAVAATSATASPPAAAMAATSAASSAMAPVADSDSISETMLSPPDSTLIKSDPQSSVRQGHRLPSAAIVTGHLILFPIALLALLSLVDPGRLNQRRHYDILPLLLISLVSVLPNGSLQMAILAAVVMGVAGRLIYGLRNSSMPKAVVPQLDDRNLLVLTFSAFIVTAFLHSVFGWPWTNPLVAMAIVTRVAMAIALVLIGQRWKNRTLGLSLALVWLVLPGSHPPIAAALVLWAFVFVNRAPLAGILAGCAIATNWWLCFLVPLWFSYYRGKARARFLTTTATCGLGGMLALAVLPWLLTIRDANAEITSMSAGEFLLHGVSVVVLAGTATATWIWPKTKSESDVTLLSTLILLCIFVCSRTPSSMGLAFPWLVLVLLGGCASRSSPLVAEGLVMPNIRRWMKRPDKAGSSQGT
jgi:formylglycine-generating enzyme required for sulfatase activity